MVAPETYLLTARVGALVATIGVFFAFLKVWALIRKVREGGTVKVRWKALYYLTPVFTTGYALSTVLLFVSPEGALLWLALSIYPWVFLVGSVMLYSVSMMFARSYESFLEYERVEFRKEKVQETQPLRVAMEPKTVYVFKDARPDWAMGVFADLVKHGHHGFMVTRILPETIRKTYGLQETPIKWLTSEIGEPYMVHPKNLDPIGLMILDFMLRAEKSVILLQGLEYLASHNGFEALLLVVDKLKDRVAMNDSRLILTFDPKAFSDREVALLEQATMDMDQVTLASESGVSIGQALRA